MAKQQSDDLFEAPVHVVTGEDGVEYSLLKGPHETSTYVIEAHKAFTEMLQIHVLGEDLINVGKFILMAYCGVMGHLQLEIQVRDRLHSVIKLCDDTVHTLNVFSQVSNNAITNAIWQQHINVWLMG